MINRAQKEAPRCQEGRHEDQGEEARDEKEKANSKEELNT